MYLSHFLMDRLIRFLKKVWKPNSAALGLAMGDVGRGAGAPSSSAVGAAIEAVGESVW